MLTFYIIDLKQFIKIIKIVITPDYLIKVINIKILKSNIYK